MARNYRRRVRSVICVACQRSLLCSQPYAISQAVCPDCAALVDNTTLPVLQLAETR